MEGKIVAIKEKKTGKGQTYWGVLVGETWANCFDQKFAHFQKGDIIKYELKKDGKFTNLELIGDGVPDKDVNGDVQPELKLDPVSHKDFTNESIENQVLIKAVAEIVGKNIESRKDDEIFVISTLISEVTENVIKAFKAIQKRNTIENAQHMCEHCARQPICDKEPDPNCEQFVDQMEVGI